MLYTSREDARSHPAPDGGYANGNTAEGTDALFSLTSGVWNVAIGFQALHSDNTGTQNTATGYRALFSNTTGSRSTAYGSLALYNNTTGSNNVAMGFNTLFSNTTGNNNTGNGFRTLAFNNGDDNTATGFNALYNNRIGVENTATGSHALLSNTTGYQNTASGAFGLFSNTTGNSNTAVANFALYSNTGGYDNTAVGISALQYNTLGHNNTANGAYALVFNVTGSGNTAIGLLAGSNLTRESGNVCIGAGVLGVAGESNTIRIGNEDITDTYISGISGTTVASGAAVLVDSSGHLGTLTSSKRFKEAIKSMDNASESLFALKPVTFRYKKGVDPQGISQFGLVAEEVEAVNSDLVVRDKEGKPYTVRYDAVNAMLLNEFLKEHRKVEKLEAMVAQQRKEFEAALTDLKGQIQKVSAQLERSKAVPQTVAENQ